MCSLVVHQRADSTQTAIHHYRQLSPDKCGTTAVAKKAASVAVSAARCGLKNQQENHYLRTAKRARAGGCSGRIMRISSLVFRTVDRF